MPFWVITEGGLVQQISLDFFVPVTMTNCCIASLTAKIPLPISRCYLFVGFWEHILPKIKNNTKDLQIPLYPNDLTVVDMMGNQEFSSLHTIPYPSSI